MIKKSVGSKEKISSRHLFVGPKSHQEDNDKNKHYSKSKSKSKCKVKNGKESGFHKMNKVEGKRKA